MFSALWKHTSSIEYYVHIWQVLPLLSCSDTCQICMWFKDLNRYFCKIETIAYGEIKGDLAPPPGASWSAVVSYPHNNNATYNQLQCIQYSSNRWYVCTYYNDVIMSAVTSQITSVSIACSTVYSDADRQKHQSSADRWIPRTKGQ